MDVFKEIIEEIEGIGEKIGEKIEESCKSSGFEEGEKPVDLKNKIIEYNGRKIRGNGKKDMQHSVKQRMATLLLLPVTIPITILITFFALRSTFAESLLFYGDSFDSPSSQPPDSGLHVFLLAGLYFLVDFVVHLFKRMRCKEPVTATATYIAEEVVYSRGKARRRAGSSRGDPMPSPKRVWVAYYKYYYNGYCGYTNCKATSIKKDKPQLGESFEILVNPSKPEEYVGNDFESKLSAVLPLIIALILFATTLPSLFFTLVS